MTRYEYKVLPAPSKGRKASGVKGPEGRFAHELEEVMNALGTEGWEYQRSDILPSEERQGLTSSHVVYRSVLVFRRALNDAIPEVLGTPAPDAPEKTPTPAPPAAEPDDDAPPEATDDDDDDDAGDDAKPGDTSDDTEPDPATILRRTTAD